MKTHSFIQENKTGRTTNYLTSNYDTGDNRNKGDLGELSLPFEGHKVHKNSGEEGRGSTNGLIERNGQIFQRIVFTNDRGAEDEAKSRDLEELNPRSDRLHRNHLYLSYGDVAEQRGSSHMAYHMEDRHHRAFQAQNCSEDRGEGERERAKSKAAKHEYRGRREKGRSR
ncbi:hypothetical protein Cgig2_026619 [Carnegiea gigantea]|uniref:Uncharacterized protein n=1 Tax=Carnegiea gigantea TaxID=171969 RepID=A0A9Q1Q8Y0_9CARY|nr:hypothetical protein Cgig2_026619 [Carnegiea gigantea]